MMFVEFTPKCWYSKPQMKKFLGDRNDARKFAIRDGLKRLDLEETITVKNFIETALVFDWNYENGDNLALARGKELFAELNKRFELMSAEIGKDAAEALFEAVDPRNGVEVMEEV